MKRIYLLFGFFIALPVHALDVFTTVPEWAALAKEIGGDQVSVFSATQGLQDPHHIEARPALIARARRAELLVATGAELEIGWLPVILRESANPKIQPGSPGYFEAADSVRMLEVPGRLDRADGDVHARGNPHIQTDPRNILKVAEALGQRMALIDSGHAEHYRAGTRAFVGRWRAAMARWEAQAASFRGAAVVSQHKSFVYLYDWLGLKELATLEPKPGVDPSIAGMSELLHRISGQSPRAVLRSAYNSPRAAEWFSQQAKVPVVVLPFTVGGNDEAKDLFALFDDTITRLKAALK